MPPSTEPSTWVDSVLRAGSVVLALAIVGLSLGPAPEEPTFDISDKVIHGLAYFSLTLAVLLAWVGRPGRLAQPLQVALSVTLVIVSGGLLVELAQSLVSRQTEILDALANALGAGLALGLWALVMRASPERS
jgi:VanZ family protein